MPYRGAPILAISEQRCLGSCEKQGPMKGLAEDKPHTRAHPCEDTLMSLARVHSGFLGMICVATPVLSIRYRIGCTQSL